MRTGSKTPDGVTVFASQRAKHEQIRVRSAGIAATPKGNLQLHASIGSERGASISIFLSLEEIMAWLPELHEKAKDHAVRKALATDA